MAAKESPGAVGTAFEVVTPILRVQQLSASIEHYVGVLGFRVDWTDEGMASVSRDRCAIMLCEGHQGNPGTWVWIGVEDAGALFAEYRASGAAIRLEPTDYPWAYEMQVTDPDGHVLRFGSEPRTNPPSGGQGALSD
jgi:predicted enzyme related to lactoylglutathione lyase